MRFAAGNSSRAIRSPSHSFYAIRSPSVLRTRSSCSPAQTPIVWKPGANADRPPWLLAPQHAPMPKYHVLVEDSPAQFLYAGPAHLGCYSMDGSDATFTLAAPLQREAWVRFGGYAHWLVQVNH